MPALLLIPVSPVDAMRRTLTDIAIGGCCPVGFVCGAQSCTPPAGVTNTITSCPFNYFLCPESLGGGCCTNGMGCAQNQCYSTEPFTSTIARPTTITTDGSTVTTTRTAVTVITPTPPTSFPTGDASFAPKFIPTAVPKIPAVPTSSGGGGGLTSAQVGGIVGGVIVLLVAVIAAAFFIIRRLNSVVEVVESRKSSSNSHTRSQSTPGVSQIQYGYIDDSSVDPLMMTPNGHLGGSGANTPPRGGHRGRSGSSNLSPSRNGFSPDGRHPSLDSTPSGGYVDIPQRVHNLPGGRPGMPTMRSSVDSHSTQGGIAHQHARNQSNASELSDGSEGVNIASPLVQELDSSSVWVELPTDGRESSLSQNRSRANSGVSPRVSFSTGRRGDAAAFGPLDVVNESAEIMHGYYGPRDRQVGQTAAGLGVVHWDVSSPVAATGAFSREGGQSVQPAQIEQPPETQQPPQEQGQGQGQTQQPKQPPGQG